MDEDDDFFNMRNRFRMPVKRKQASKDKDDDSDSELRGKRTEDYSAEEANPVRPEKKKQIIALSSSDNEEEDENNDLKNASKRHSSLTPPPVIAPEAYKQAMAVITRHMTKNPDAHADNKTQTISDGESSSFEDDFDVSAYKATMNSDISRQATALNSGKGQSTPEKEAKIVFLLFRARKMESDKSVPQDWENPVEFRVSRSFPIQNLRDEFKNRRAFKGEIILSWKGVRLWRGTPEEIGFGSQEVIDVYTESGWEIHLLQEKKKKEEKETEIINLDDEQNEPIDVPKQISLILQSSTKGKLKLKVLETATIKKMANVFRNACKVPATTKVTFVLDGESLDENETVRDLSLDDDDVIDVMIGD